MVEVFKTNVISQTDATALIEHIRESHDGCSANFDLQDCDHILRITSEEWIDPTRIIHTLRKHGFRAEILQDIPVTDFNSWLNGEIEDIGLRPDFH